MFFRLVVCAFILSTVKDCRSFETASFYGGSYITVPLQDAKSTTEIQLRFRTNQADALLFLVAGKTDYCLIKLQSGKLEVHINLGAGESELSSPKGLRLDDRVWHHVTLNRNNSEVNVTIDNIHIIREKLPGRYFELNIYGLFLGGSGYSLELFLGHFKWLRGCLSAVLYNGVDVLNRARYRTFQSDVHGITWSCASEFDATFNSDVSFMEDGAFVSLPYPISPTGVRWQFEMKTIAEDAMLFYNSKLVQAGRYDYVGLEITKRKLRLVMDAGGGMMEVFNEATITDGEWHLVTVQINPSMLEIVVDGKIVGSVNVTSKTSNMNLNLDEVVYVGGLELNKKTNALAVGMKSVDKSFKGCLRSMEVDGKQLGFPNAKVTQGVLPNCIVCSKKPCVVGASCTQYGVDTFHCECDKPFCVSSDYTSKNMLSSKSSLPIVLEILSLNPVRVMEGENVLITTDNINVVLDYAKYLIRDSGVAFYISQPPRYGSVSIGSNDLVSGSVDTNSMFTLKDLSDKVHYIHDGSENYNDSLMLDLKFTSSVEDFILPGYLQGKNSFVLHIDIAPVNDPPFLFIPPTKDLTLAEGTRKVITADLLNASDSDNSNSELTYTVLNQASGSGMNGYIAKLEAPSIPVTSFTQEDIDFRKVVFVHNGNTTGEDKIALQVSDGVGSSSISFLRISVFSLQLHLVNNTGITLAQKSSTLITNNNLAFKTNTEDPLLLIKYEIIEFPKFGVLQCLTRGKNDQEVWQAVTLFTDQQVQREELRYVHTEDTSSMFDVFKFRASVKNLILPSIYEFRMTFVQLRLKVIANETIRLTGSQTAHIHESNLKVATEPLPTNSSTVVFTILRTPRVSDLVKGDVVLRKNGVWTQKDVTDGKLAFQLHRNTFSTVEDSVVFSVSAPQCEVIEHVMLNFKYQPTEKQMNKVQAFVRPVQVSEGSQQPLLLEHLNVVKENVSLVTYQVLSGPNHGWLDMYDVDHTTVEKRNVTQFVNTDIMKQKVTYTHDDSESVSDIILLVAYSDRGESFQFVLELPFEILLKNDNPPYCIVNNGLNVVVGGDKILSAKDLLYGDADIDTQPETISYTRRVIPNGAFILSNSPHSPLFEFSQNDINEGRVMFRHNGLLTSKISMWVSDGNSFFEFSFNIVASAPYVKVMNNSKILLRQGGEAFLTAGNLFSSTNMNVPSQLIRYKILKNPEVGQLELADRNGSVRVFTQDDIEKRSLVYRHTKDLKSVKDTFSFEVSVQDKFAEDELHVRIFPSVYWEPLVLVNNRTQYVDEASDVQITRDDLLVQQAHVPPSDISYFVVEQPKYGYLEIEVNGRFLEVDISYLFNPNNTDESKDTAITFFDQATVDAEKLHYIQVILNQTYDRVVLDATNGIVWFRNIVLNFVIIPEQLYISGGELHVDEGEFVRLTTSLFSVYSPYYADKLSEFKVKKFPQHGWLQFIGLASKNSNVSRWTMTQLQNKQIQYIHDGSETSNDSMTIVAFAADKESALIKVNIVVLPVNDEMPKVVNNTGTSVWRGGICNINSSNLAVVDNDTPASNITFVILSAQAGYLAYFSNLNTTIDKFTQAEIDAGKITFVHSGAEADGEFDTAINDGKHTTEPVTFRVKILLPSLHLSKSIDFQIFPMLRKAITPLHLLTWCSDTDKNIFYVVKSPPKYGVLTTIDADMTMPVSNFSQADVNASRIWYQHTAHAVDANSSTDAFWFDVVASYAIPVLNEMLRIKIAVSSGGLDGLLDIETYQVEEGGSVKLFVNTSNMVSFLSSDNIGLRWPSLKATITVAPSFGSICVQEDCSVEELTNEQMNAGVSYRHDHSDSRYDNVTLTLYLEQDNITLCNVTIHIVVNPINDQPFKLVQDSPNLSIVQGEKFSLTQDQLLTTDKDSPAEDIVYDVINGPSIGSIYVDGVKGVGRFTQADVNAGRVVYEHAGPVQSCSFHFRVSDGHFTPTYKVFNIFVHAAKLGVVVSRPIFLSQGSNWTTVPAGIFLVQTNHKFNDVTYNVTTLPRYGFILVNHSSQTTFTHTDLKAKKVVYVQSDLSVPSDAFEIEASLSLTDSRARNLWVNISVEPFLKVGHFAPVAGLRNCLSKEVLNADALAKKSNSSPIFSVIKKPKYGKLQKIIKRNRKGSGDRSGKVGREIRTVKQEDVDKFTYDEINSKVVYYVARKANASVEDSFAFLLSATSVQPAIGELKFLVSTESAAASRTTSPPSKPKTAAPSRSKSSTKIPYSASETSGDGDVEIASPNMTTDDYYLFVSLLFCVLIVSLIFVILVRCRSKKRAEEDMKMHPPLPLPRPPDDLLPSSPYPKRGMLHSTPQCKVIPLGTDSLTSSEHDFNLRYPYGAADEDWSSCDTSGGGAAAAAAGVGYSTQRNNNPMLRKNQYWV